LTYFRTPLTYIFTCRAEPFQALVKNVLPSLAADARDQIILIVEQAEKTGQEIALQDGFDLYQEMMEIRAIYQQALPKFVSQS